MPMFAVYGLPPAELAAIPNGAVQTSPLVPGGAALAELSDATVDRFVVHAPRGTLERRYVMANALRALKPGAAFAILAHNKQGGTRIRDELIAFGVAATEEAKHHHRICTGFRPAQPVGLDAAITDGAPRFVAVLDAWTQPGIFSWDRIDPGTALLIDHLPPLAGRGADPGSGIGLLARAVLRQPAVTHMTLVDIDRRAVEAARRNVDAARSSVTWADMRRDGTLRAGLDFVVMNPPFHDGGREDQDLGRTFIARAAEALRPGGLCVLVANRHLPYEAALKPLFANVDLLFQGGGYKIYQARR